MTKWLMAVGVVALSACPPNPNPPVVVLPAAEVPVLETILDIDAARLIPFDGGGDHYRVTPAPLNRLYLRLRAPWPTDFTVALDGAALPVVNDTAAHPELAASGYFRVDPVAAVTLSDPLLFWRILVVVPDGKRGVTSPLQLAVTNLSRDPNATGAAKQSSPLQITVRPFDATRAARKPSAIFFSGDNQKHPLSAKIADDVIVAGWIANPLDRGGLDGGGTEDVHFGLWLDADFITRNYQLVHALDGAIIPGRPYTDFDNIFHPAQHVPLTGGTQPTATTFLMPGLDHLNLEQNAWHLSKRGASPPGWFADVTAGHADDSYAQLLTLPDNSPGGQPFNEGDYVVLSGVLIEDSAHLHFPNNTPQDNNDWRHKCWDEVSKGNGGWLELHPFDAMRKLRPPAVRKHLQLVAVCNLRDQTTPLPSEFNAYLTPMVGDPPTANSILRFEELIDSRFTDMATVTLHTVEISPCQPAKLHVRVRVGNGGHFLAQYNLWWEEGGQPRPAPIVCTPPPGESPPGDLPVCSKKPYLPQCDPVKEGL